jgi:hypothetical protein
MSLTSWLQVYESTTSWRMSRKRTRGRSRSFESALVLLVDMVFERSCISKTSVALVEQPTSSKSCNLSGEGFCRRCQIMGVLVLQW